jgi:general secretion pathway protein E
MLDLGVPAYLLNATVLGVKAQRLVRTLCPHCKHKVPYGEDRAEDVAWEELVTPWKARPPGRVYKAVGCLECRMTGFRGRSGLYEVMLLSPGIKRLISTTPDLGKMREQAYKEGMKSLRISGAMKVAAGTTTLEEVLKVAPPHQHEGA